MKRRAALVSAALVLVAGAARAEPTAEDRGTYLHLLGTADLGRSLRFNDPFRLEEPLGKTPESVSLAAPYLDLGLGVLGGLPEGLQHGLYVHWSHALSGVAQDVIAPSYMAYFRLAGPIRPYARFGLPIVASPDPNAGLELAAGATWALTSGLAAHAEIGDAYFYGAATRQVSATLVPIVWAQLGVAVDVEVLP